MAKTKKAHRRAGPGKPQGMNYAQVLARKAAIQKGLEQAAGMPPSRWRRTPHPAGHVADGVLHRRRLRLRPGADAEIFLGPPGQHRRAGADARRGG